MIKCPRTGVEVARKCPRCEQNDTRGRTAFISNHGFDRYGNSRCYPPVPSDKASHAEEEQQLLHDGDAFGEIISAA